MPVRLKKVEKGATGVLRRQTLHCTSPVTGVCGSTVNCVVEAGGFHRQISSICVSGIDWSMARSVQSSGSQMAFHPGTSE